VALNKPPEKTFKGLAQMAKLPAHCSLADHEDLAYLLPSTKLMIIARKNGHIQHRHTTIRVS